MVVSVATSCHGMLSLDASQSACPYTQQERLSVSPPHPSAQAAKQKARVLQLDPAGSPCWSLYLVRHPHFPPILCHCQAMACSSTSTQWTGISSCTRTSIARQACSRLKHVEQPSVDPCSKMCSLSRRDEPPGLFHPLVWSVMESISVTGLLIQIVKNSTGLYNPKWKTASTGVLIQKNSQGTMCSRLWGRLKLLQPAPADGVS